MKKWQRRARLGKVYRKREKAKENITCYFYLIIPPFVLMFCYIEKYYKVQIMLLNVVSKYVFVII